MLNIIVIYLELRNFIFANPKLSNRPQLVMQTLL